MPHRDLPSVDVVIRHATMAALISQWGVETVKACVRTLQADARAQPEPPAWATAGENYEGQVAGWLSAHVGHGYRNVFNLTGTVIHTNLGRSLLSERMMRAALEAATRPVTLEYDLRRGRRGDREAIVTHRLRLLTGAEAATVVNNNAAAVLLVLNTLALNKAVPVSRGELIEIGGSFRLPDIMKRARSRLVEVGTTNRTHLRDYEEAIDASTRLLLKVHPSNYHIGGFTKSVSASELADLGKRHQIPVCVDVGSGTLVDLTKFGLPYEPRPQDVLADGVDLVTFSGDKLLGSVQAGIIVGRKDLIDKLNRNPLKRALRADKITLAVLAETLKAYEDPSTLVEHIPLLKTLTTPLNQLRERAEMVAAVLRDRLDDFQIEVVDCESQLGSGALPDQLLPSAGVAVSSGSSRAKSPAGSRPSQKAVRALETRLRGLPTPVVCRLHDGRLWLDMRGASPIDELLVTLESLH
ncbi:MAG: L-seryl-tRNA(Sec) selenium transferase [Gammaproteobacteria bacterium]|nr:L-seryl-tRNA(Sec) selenium transferase [Gammaproteobacteria bacterium]